MYAVILAGGGGTRLHPLSRPEYPKPFLPLLGAQSLLQGTVERLAGLTTDVTVVTDRLGIDGTTLDLVVAVLGSLAANGLGAVLIAYGAHAPAERQPERGSHPTARDTAQTSFPAVAAISAAGTPETRGKRVTKRKATVLAFPGRHPVLRALAANGGTAASNRDLARLMGVTEGEASKRVGEVAHLLTIERNGKETRISLKAQRVA